jgi:transcriptional regulator with XRE-family HTH domain
VGRKRHRLIERRRSIGLSQEGLAEATGVDRSTAARWERGESDPYPAQRPRLANALKVTVEEVGELLADGERAASTGGRLRYAVEYLGRVDLVTVAHLRQRVYDLDARYVTTPPTSLLADASECLSQAVQLRAAATTSRVQRELHAIEAEAAILMGQLVWDASQRRDHAATRTYLSWAVGAAQACNDPIAEGWALLRTTIVALYGEKDPKAALTIARRIAETTRSSHVLTGLGIMHAAEAHAMMQRRKDCERALAEGEALLERMSPTDAAVDLSSPTDHSRMAGSCYLFLGDAQRAQAMLETAAIGFRDVSKSQAVVLGNLSLAYLRQRKLDEAVATLHQAIDVVEQTRGGGGLTTVFTAGRELRPWQDIPNVQNVRDRLLDLVAG